MIDNSASSFQPKYDLVLRFRPSYKSWFIRVLNSVLLETQKLNCSKASRYPVKGEVIRTGIVNGPTDIIAQCHLQKPLNTAGLLPVPSLGHPDSTVTSHLLSLVGPEETALHLGEQSREQLQRTSIIVATNLARASKRLTEAY